MSSRFCLPHLFAPPGYPARLLIFPKESLSFRPGAVEPRATVVPYETSLLFLTYCIIQFAAITMSIARRLGAPVVSAKPALDRGIVISDCRDVSETNARNVRKTSARLAFGSVDPITARTTNECHRPLAGPRISNPVSVITAAETRRR